MKKVLLTAAVAASVALGVAPAFAYVACNSDGDCWHTDARVAVPGVTFNYHPDDWYFHQHWDGGDRHWRDYHEGRGYYRSGVWIGL